MSSRFFIEGRREAGERVAFDSGDAHKMLAVLRLNDGDTVEVIDSAAQRFTAMLHIEGRTVSAVLGDPVAPPRSTLPAITVAQGVPKGQKMDFVVEKLTELGAAAIIPLQSERTVVSDVSPNKLERWRRLAKTAAQQCGRSDVPAVADAVEYERVLESFAGYDCVLLPWELADNAPLRDRLPQLVTGARSILVLIGPEGGFSHHEADAAQRAGAHLISLGSRILRTETAALVVLSILGYALEA